MSIKLLQKEGKEARKKAFQVPLQLFSVINAEQCSCSRMW